MARIAACSGCALRLAGRQARAFGQCGQLRPNDTRVDLARGGEAGKAAIGAGDHVLPPDDAGKARNALGDRLGMLDQIGGVRDYTGNEDFAFRQFDRLPDPPLMLVARVGGVEE